MCDLTEKQSLTAMVRNGFTKHEGLLNSFRRPDLPDVMFMTILIQANGYKGALKTALSSRKKAQGEKGGRL